MKRPKRLFPGREFQQRVLSADQTSITGEAEYIVSRAMAREGRIVSMGPLIFFSTEIGDAWMLDATDSLALPLALEGDRQPFIIEETRSRFVIEWTGGFEIDRAGMIYHDHTGASWRIPGCPVNAILTTLALDRR